MDLSSLTEGNYSVEYTVTDSDKNTVIVPRKVIVLKNNVDNEVKPEETPDAPDASLRTPRLAVQVGRVSTLKVDPGTNGQPEIYRGF